MEEVFVEVNAAVVGDGEGSLMRGIRMAIYSQYGWEMILLPIRYVLDLTHGIVLIILFNAALVITGAIGLIAFVIIRKAKDSCLRAAAYLGIRKRSDRGPT